jgi:hypothetical protein
MTYLCIPVVVWVLLYRHLKYLWRPQYQSKNQTKNQRRQRVPPVQSVLDG